MKKLRIAMIVAAACIQQVKATAESYQQAKAAYLALPESERTRSEYLKVVASVSKEDFEASPATATDYLAFWQGTPYVGIDVTVHRVVEAWTSLGQTNNALAFLRQATAEVPDKGGTLRAERLLAGYRQSVGYLIRLDTTLSSEECAVRIATALSTPSATLGHGQKMLIKMWGVYGPDHPTIKPMSRLYGTLEAEYKPVFKKGAEGLAEAGWWSDNVSAKIVAY
jgi:hypothetical protein